jgi:hypothetical protein
MSLTNQRKQWAKAAVDDAIYEANQIARSDSTTRHAFEQLLRHVQRTTSLLRPVLGGGRIKTVGIRRIIAGLLAMASHCRDWLRPVPEWTCICGNALPQFGSLALHLFARYPVPAFMTAVWMREPDADSAKHQGWYKHIGSGQNIRNVDLPLHYTKRMAHHFMLAPDHFTVQQAFRWGQVRGFGGSEVLAGAIAATRLGQSFEHEEFWKTVVQFFVNELPLDPHHVGPIVDYLNDQRFVPQDVLIEEGELGPLGPLQPDLTMKGRTRRSILRQLEEWQKRLRHNPKSVQLRWPQSHIGEFRYIEHDEHKQRPPRTWTIRELLSSAELSREGLAMQHCAASYARSCARRTTSVWSMRLDRCERRERVMTIEVDLRRKLIRQARRRRNAWPGAKPREILGRWAEQEGLFISHYL